MEVINQLEDIAKASFLLCVVLWATEDDELDDVTDELDDETDELYGKELSSNLLFLVEE